MNLTYSLPKLQVIAVDIDGTLTDRAGLLDPNAVATLQFLIRMGIRVVLVSGRSFFSTGTLSTYLVGSGLVVAENGGVLGCYPHSMHVLADRMVVEKALAVLKKRMGNVIQIENMPDRITDVVCRRTFNLETANRILNEEDVPAKVVDTSFAYHIMDKRCNKGRALQVLAQQYGFDLDRCCAFGDYDNDIPLLKVCRVGIAVGNASSKLKEVATYVSQSKYGAGFVEGIRWLIRTNLL